MSLLLLASLEIIFRIIWFEPPDGIEDIEDRNVMIPKTFSPEELEDHRNFNKIIY